MRKTVRAIIQNAEGKYYLAIHHYRNPENAGKWSTLGGKIEESDKSLESALRREFVEELGEIESEKIEIKSFVDTLEKIDGIHYFFECRCESLDFSLVDKSEIIEVNSFDLDEIAKLKEQNLLFFGDELRLIQNIVSKEPGK